MTGTPRDGVLSRWRVPLAAWASSRLAIFVLAMAFAAAYGVPDRGIDRDVPHLLSTLGAWDTNWYLDVARHGYDDYTGLVGVFFTNLAFFPLLPVVMKIGLVMGLNPFLFALVVGNLAFLGALGGLHVLTAERYGQPMAVTAVWAVALFPPAVYASMAYTEGLVMGLAVGAALLARRGAWLPASVVASVATVGRPPGILVAVLVAVMAYHGDGARAARLRRAALCMLPSLILMVGFLAWMQSTRGSWSLPFTAQGAWQRAPLIIGLVTYLPNEIGQAIVATATLDFSSAWTAMARDIGFTALYLILLRRLWRMEGGLSSPWVVYSAGALALPLSSGSFTSMARFGLLAFPLAWAGADWVLSGGPMRRALTASAGILLTVLLVAQLLIRSP